MSERTSQDLILEFTGINLGLYILFGKSHFLEEGKREKGKEITKRVWDLEAAEGEPFAQVCGLSETGTGE